MTSKISLCLLLMLSASGLWAQSPTPAQGRDYTGAIYRVVAVDSAGRLIISPMGSSGGCVGTAMIPCIVAGPDTPGAAPTQNPVQFSLYDGANVRRVLGDAAGRLFAVGPAALGAAPVGGPLYVASAFKSGATPGALAVPSVCDQQANVVLTAGTSIRLITGVAGRTFKICHLIFVGTTAADFTLQQGTGSTCGTGTASIYGPQTAITATFFDDDGHATIDSTSTGQDACALFSTTVTVTIWVKYAIN